MILAMAACSRSGPDHHGNRADRTDGTDPRGRAPAAEPAAEEPASEPAAPAEEENLTETQKIIKGS